MEEEEKDGVKEAVSHPNIDRKDVAEGMKCYQSSTVDNLNADYAIMPPYQTGSKTRREVDPWWEIDLGITLHIHSVVFSVVGALQNDMRSHVLLFDGPIGHEDPFFARSY